MCVACVTSFFQPMAGQQGQISSNGGEAKGVVSDITGRNLLIVGSEEI
jgi:hypothetical protein